MKLFHLALFGLLCGSLTTTTSVEAALTTQDKTFLKTLSVQTTLDDPTLGASRHEKRVIARIAKEQRNPSTKAGELSNLCLLEGSCHGHRRRHYRRGHGGHGGRRFVDMGPRARSTWFLWRGWWQLGGAYTAAVITGAVGLAIASSAGAAPSVNVFFGMMFVPVAGPLISFIIAMANVNGTGADVAWILGGIGALAMFIPQTIGLIFVILGYTTMARLDRGRHYGNTDPNKPSWAITPYVDPNGGGLAVFGRF